MGLYQVPRLPVGTEDHSGTEAGGATSAAAGYGLHLPLGSSEPEELSSHVSGAKRGTFRARAIAGVRIRRVGAEYHGTK